MVGRFALHGGRPDIARHLIELVRNPFGGVVDHDLATLHAGIAAAEGRTADALALYRSAIGGYREAGCRFDVALTIFDMARLIGPDEPAVNASIPEAREILESLEARPLIERLDALMAGRRAVTPPSTRLTVATSEAAER